MRPPPKSTLFPYPTLFRSLGSDLAAPADRLRLLGGRTPLREEEVRVDTEAVGLLLPAAFLRPAVRVGGTGPQTVCSDDRSEEHTPELPSQSKLVCRLLPEK